MPSFNRGWKLFVWLNRWRWYSFIKEKEMVTSAFKWCCTRYYIQSLAVLLHYMSINDPDQQVWRISLTHMQWFALKDRFTQNIIAYIDFYDISCLPIFSSMLINFTPRCSKPFISSHGILLVFTWSILEPCNMTRTCAKAYICES